MEGAVCELLGLFIPNLVPHEAGKGLQDGDEAWMLIALGSLQVSEALPVRGFSFFLSPFSKEDIRYSQTIPRQRLPLRRGQ